VGDQKVQFDPNQLLRKNKNVGFDDNVSMGMGSEDGQDKPEEYLDEFTARRLPKPEDFFYEDPNHKKKKKKRQNHEEALEHSKKESTINLEVPGKKKTLG
jgi:hypothetical protein